MVMLYLLVVASRWDIANDTTFDVMSAVTFGKIGLEKWYYVSSSRGCYVMMVVVVVAAAVAA